MSGVVCGGMLADDIEAATVVVGSSSGTDGLAGDDDDN